MRSFAPLPVLATLLFAIACTDLPEPTGLVAAFDEGPLLSTADGDGGSIESGATVTTDKGDYQPGDTVTISGAGWWPGETVSLHISEEPPNHPDHDFGVVAGEDGGFVHRELVLDELHLGVTFTLTATGQASGMVAGAVFTDGNPQSPVVTGQNPNPVVAGSSATFAVTVPYDGNSNLCTVVLSATVTGSPAWPGAPPGGFFSFSPGSVTAGGGSAPTSC